MPITITTTPDKLVASKNDSWSFVQTDDQNVVIQMNAFDATANKKIASLIAPVDANNKAMFNSKRILQSMGVVPDVLGAQLPSFAQNIASLSNNNIKAYYLQFQTINKANAQVISTAQTSNLQVLLSGKSFINGNKNLLQIIGDGAGVQRKFLTCQPQARKTSKSTQQYLFYYHNENGISTGATSFSMRVTMLLNDDSTIVKVVTPITLTHGQVAIFPVGYTQLNLGQYAPANKKITSYDVRLVLTSDSSKVISNVFTYQIDTRCLIRKKDFLFLNSLGGLDTMTAIDTQEIISNVQTEIAQRMLPYQYNTHDGEYYNFFKLSSLAMKCISDLLTYDERLYLQEFFLSTNVYEITSTDFVPVILTDGDLSLHKARNDLQSVPFAFRYAFDEIAYNNF